LDTWHLPGQRTGEEAAYRNNTWLPAPRVTRRWRAWKRRNTLRVFLKALRAFNKPLRGLLKFTLRVN
ncbi:hypothetical protein, partial [Streptomyces anulatus]|uniref:hypothetical protein n=1 Tax=Streptomyces anulatus TaxID=1892 RepID=UPI00343C921B